MEDLLQKIVVTRGVNKFFLKAILTLILLTWRIWRDNNARKWQMGLNSAFNGLKRSQNQQLDLILSQWNSVHIFIRSQYYIINKRNT